MATSVLSRVPSLAAGITISKHQNQLKGNIVKALPCLKSFIHQDLFFQEVINAAQEEQELDLVDEDLANHESQCK